MKFLGKGDGHKSTTGKDYHTALHCGCRVKDSFLKDSPEHHMVIVDHCWSGGLKEGGLLLRSNRFISYKSCGHVNLD